jgi:hypothetical protein
VLVVSFVQKVSSDKQTHVGHDKPAEESDLFLDYDFGDEDDEPAMCVIFFMLFYCSLV